MWPFYPQYVKAFLRHVDQVYTRPPIRAGSSVTNLYQDHTVKIYYDPGDGRFINDEEYIGTVIAGTSRLPIPCNTDHVTDCRADDLVENQCLVISLTDDRYKRKNLIAGEWALLDLNAITGWEHILDDGTAPAAHEDPDDRGESGERQEPEETEDSEVSEKSEQSEESEEENVTDEDDVGCEAAQ